MNCGLPLLLLYPFKLLLNRLTQLVITAKKLNQKHQSQSSYFILVSKALYINISTPNLIKGEVSSLVTNLQSAKNKIPQIENLINTSEPTIILGN